MDICNKTVALQAVRSKKKGKKSCEFPVLGIIAAPVANTGDVSVPEMYILITLWREGRPGPYSSLLLVS